MRRLLCLLLLAPAICLAATGDWDWFTVETNGWVLQGAVNGYSTNGLFSFGFGTNQSGTGKLSVTVVSPGFSDSGVSNAVTRTIYATKQLRQPWPYQTNYAAITNGSDLVLRMALSDYVFSNDVIQAIAVLPGVYSNSTSVIGNITNGSTCGYSQVHAIANWSWPGWQRITNNTMTLKAVGFHRSGQLGRPLKVIQFVAQDQHSNAVTNWVTRMSIDPTVGDASPVTEYIAQMNVGGFTNGDQIRCDFTAFPWVGDSGAVLSTFDNANTWPTPLWTSITNLCDRTQTYYGPIGTWAICATNGSDATGVACTNASPFMTNCFLTINGALLAIKGTNNNQFGHSDCGAGTVFLTQGKNWVWVGGSGSYSTKPPCWVTVTRWITNSVSQVVIGDQGGNKKICDRDLINGVTIASTNTTATISGNQSMWYDQCVINSTNSTLFYINTVQYYTRNTVSNLSMGFGPSGTVLASPSIIRGNTIQNYAGQAWFTYTVLGNVRNITNSCTKGIMINEYNGQTIPRADGAIVAYNQIYGFNCSTIAALQLCTTTNQTFGMAIVQNIVESPFDAGSQPVCRVVSDSDTATATSNILLWNNTFLGERVNLFYNDSGTVSFTRTLNSVKNNLFDNENIKSDTFGTPSGNRIGNWSELWSVGWSGNLFGNVNGIGAVGFSHAGTLDLAVGGLNTFQTDTSLPVGYYQFVNQQSYDGSSIRNGLGFYRIQSQSPAVGWKCDNLIPYDIEGNARGLLDPPGAYSSSSPNKGAAFLGF